MLCEVIIALAVHAGLHFGVEQVGQRVGYRRTALNADAFNQLGQILPGRVGSEMTCHWTFIQPEPVSFGLICRLAQGEADIRAELSDGAAWLSGAVVRCSANALGVV